MSNQLHRYRIVLDYIEGWNGWYAINVPKAEQIYRRHMRRLDRDGTA